MTSFEPFSVKPKHLQAGQRFSLSATGEEKAQLAARFGVRGVERAQAEVLCISHTGPLFSLECHLNASFLLETAPGETTPQFAQDHFILAFAPTDGALEDALMEDPPIYQELYDVDKPNLNLGEILIQYIALMVPLANDASVAAYADPDHQALEKKKPLEGLAILKEPKQ